MSLAGIQYLGLAGVSRSCLSAIVRLIQFGDKIQRADLLTDSSDHSPRHCFLLHVNNDELIAIKCGFASGYGGTGPKLLSIALKLLERHQVEINEYDVSESIIDRLDHSALTVDDIDSIASMRPVRPERWYDYIFEQDRDDSSFETLADRIFEKDYVASQQEWNHLRRHFPPVIPFAIIDSRIMDLALKFEEHPDNSLLTGYRRLEAIVRERTGLDEHGSKLFSQAFLGSDAKLCWKNISSAEQQGRANLFIGTYMAYRNRRAHHEPEEYSESLPEFLLLNQLFLLENEAIKRIEGEASSIPKNGSVQTRANG